ncbi:VENN motif pre-toxin domain-containing protein [Candidatus Odyssella thessalonicensis]|uniref:VENN motif pre-toxin domain-containing protein n=1 Tax=Candidatus Odyssella thessalonicensis TaxID=84647 RepID=UPI000225ABFD|nr:VENN motif pre-toxin domain-containing protein [Candidatus Odyssella thessalonicensis]
MFSFRKIINIFVLVAYVKMVLVSSFAMEAEFHRANQAFKLSMEPTLSPQGHIQAMRLRLIRQDRNGGKKKQSLLSQAYVDLQKSEHTANIKVVESNGSQWFEWQIPNLGTVQVDLNGNMVLQGVTQQSRTTILKIKTSHLIILRNCAVHNLHLSSHAALLEGNNRIINLKANHAFGLTAFKDRQEQLQNLILKHGRFHNTSTLTLQAGGTWDLRGNAFLNQGKLILEGGGQTIQQAGLVSNLGQIQGVQLSIITQHYLNSGMMDLAHLHIQARDNIINQGQIHTRQEGIYHFGSKFINSGKVISDGVARITSSISQGTLTNTGLLKSAQAELKSLQLVNQEYVEFQRSLLRDVHLTTLNSLKLGTIVETSIVSSLINSGIMMGNGNLTVCSGHNSGQMNLTNLMLTIQGELINQGHFWISGLAGNGSFINQGKLLTAQNTGVTKIDIAHFEMRNQDQEGSKVTGRQLILGKNLKQLLMTDQSQLLVTELYIVPPESGTEMLTLRGTLQCTQVSIRGRRVLHQGSLSCQTLSQSGGLLVLDGTQTSVGATLLDQQGRLVNQTPSNLGKLTLTSGTVQNHNQLEGEVVDMTGEVQIDNRGTWAVTLPKKDSSDHRSVSTLLSKNLSNSGQVIIRGDYAPEALKRGNTLTLALLPGRVEVLGTFWLDASQLDRTYPLLSKLYDIRRLHIDGSGRSLTFSQSYNWHFADILSLTGRKIRFQEEMNVCGLEIQGSATEPTEVIIDKQLRATEGNIKMTNVSTILVGQDNDHMGELQARQGEITLHTNGGDIDLRFAKVRAQEKLHLKAERGSIHFGERVVVPPHEVAQRVPSDPLQLMGRLTYYFFYDPTPITGNYCQFFLSNDAALVCKNGKIILEADKDIKGKFGSIFAGGGIESRAISISLLNVNMISLNSSMFKAKTLSYSRTPNEYIYLNIMGCLVGPACNRSLSQTSRVCSMFVFGNLSVEADSFNVLGNNILISHNFLFNRKPITITNAAEETSLVIKSYEHKSELGFPPSFSRQYSITEYAYHSEPHYPRGTSGGYVTIGQQLSLTNDNLICVGGGISAQLINAHLNNLHLEALHSAVPRIVLTTVCLNKLAECLANSNPIIRPTVKGGLTLKLAIRRGTEAQTPLTAQEELLEANLSETKTAPFWDEAAQRFTSTYPADVPFYLDNELERITFTEQMRVNTGRIYDDNGHSGEQLLRESTRRAQALASQGAPITEQTLKDNRTCLLFYRLQKINGQDFLVATAHIPQTTEADQTNRSGAMQGRQMGVTAKTETNIGGTKGVAGRDATLNLNIGRQNVRAATMANGRTVRAQEINEHGDIHKTLHQSSTLDGLDMSAPQGNIYFKAGGNVAMTHTTARAGQSTQVKVGENLTLKSSSITSGTGPTQVRAGTLEMETLIETIYTTYGFYQRAMADATLGSDKSFLSVQVQGDAKAMGALFHGTSIDFVTGGQRYFGAVPKYAHFEFHSKKSTVIQDSCTHHRTRLVINPTPPPTASSVPAPPPPPTQASPAASRTASPAKPGAQLNRTTGTATIGATPTLRLRPLPERQAAATSPQAEGRTSTLRPRPDARPLPTPPGPRRAIPPAAASTPPAPAQARTSAQPLGTALMCPSRNGTMLTAFYENQVSGADNDCAFNCLGISRDEAIALLLSKKDDAEARRVVAPEIKLAFTSGELAQLPGFAAMPAYQALQDQQARHQRLTTIMDNQLRQRFDLRSGHSWKDAYDHIQRQNLHRQYPEFVAEAQRYLRFDAELDAFAQQPEVYERYLYSYVNTVKMMQYQTDQYDAVRGIWKRTSSAFDLLARLLGMQLRVMVKDRDGRFKLLHEDDFDGEPTTVLHTVYGTQGGFAAEAATRATRLNHFNLLLPKDEQQDFLSFMQRQAPEGGIHISSGGDAWDEGVVTQALNGVTKRSGGTLTETVVQDWYREQHIRRKKRWTGRTKRVETKISRTTSQACQTSTQKGDVNYYAQDGILLQASEIRARKIRLETAEGVIKLLTALDIDCVETKKRSKDAIWQAQSQTFDYNERRRPCQFFYNDEDGIEFITPEGLVVEFVNEVHSRADGNKNKGKPREWQRFKDYSTQPGYEWMKLLDARDDVVRIYVTERHDSGRFASQGMTAAAKIVLSLILTIMTGGGGLAGLGVTGGAAAGGATVGAAAVSQVTMANVMSTFASAALQGGLAAASNVFMFSMIDNRLNMRNVARDMTSKSTLKNIGAAGLAAGLTGGISKATGISTSNLNGITQQLQGHAIKAVAQAATRVAFGEKPENVIKSIGANYIIDVASGTLANQIGDWRKLNIDNGLISDYVTHKLLHGILGAASRGTATKLMGGNSGEVKDAALGGAIGGMVAEIVGEGLREQVQNRHAERYLHESEGKSNAEKVALWNVIKEQEQARVRAYGELAATITAKAFGADDEAARVAARNAVDNNWVCLVYAPQVISGCAHLYRAYRAYRAAQAALNIATTVANNISDKEEGEGKAASPSSSSGGDSNSPQDEDPEEEKKKGLGNPFKGKTPEEIDKMFKSKGFEKRGPDPLNGKGGYVNPETDRSYHIDVNNRFNEPPHIDVNRLRDYKGVLPKKKYWL